MTIIKSYDVFCDGQYPSGNRCTAWADTGVTAAAGRSSHAAAEARDEARARGWKRRNGRDLCPSCAEHNR